MRKNLIIILILLGVLFFPKIFSGEILIATPVLELQEQIKLLQGQLGELLIKLSLVKKDTVPPVLSNLEPEDVVSNSGIITWGTEELSDSKVVYSEKYITEYNFYGVTPLIATNSEWVMFHRVKLENLKANTKYYYFVSSTDPSGNKSDSETHSIITKPSP